MIKIGLILSSNRTHRFGDQVLGWVQDNTKEFTDIAFTVIDPKEWNIPFFDEKMPPSMLNREYAQENSRKLGKILDEMDGFLIITPEYNHGYPAPLKNLLDSFYPEWNHKPVGFVSYGGILGGVRALEQLRQVVIELKMIPIQASVSIPHVYMAFDENGKLKDDSAISRLHAVITQLEEFVHILKK